MASATRAVELFNRFEKAEAKALVLLRGEDAYLDKEFKTILKQKSFDLKEIDLKKKAPEESLEEFGSGLSLFTSQNLLWLKNPLSPAQWRSETRALWQRMVNHCDPASNFIVVQVPSDKRLRWDALGAEAEYIWEVDASTRKPWLERMNRSRGSPLSGEALAYLATFDEEAIVLENWIELWSLGGETWAAKAIGWGQARAAKPESHFQQPAFAWVDAVLAGDGRQAQKLLRHLLENEGSEPLQLLALLNKSVRILVALENSWKLEGQPAFLVDRLRPRRGRGAPLLKICAELDRELKTSGADKFALMSRLG